VLLVILGLVRAPEGDPAEALSNRVPLEVPVEPVARRGAVSAAVVARDPNS